MQRIWYSRPRVCRLSSLYQLSMPQTSAISVIRHHQNYSDVATDHETASRLSSGRVSAAVAGVILLSCLVLLGFYHRESSSSAVGLTTHSANTHRKSSGQSRQNTTQRKQLHQTMSVKPAKNAKPAVSTSAGLNAVASKMISDLLGGGTLLLNRSTSETMQIRQIQKKLIANRTQSYSKLDKEVSGRNTMQQSSRDNRRNVARRPGESDAKVDIGSNEPHMHLVSTHQQQQQQLQQCPSSFNINDPEVEWFRQTFVQRSPLSNRSRNVADGNDEEEEILILTPVSNVARHLHRYFENLCSLTYPHRLLSVVLGEDSSSDGTYEKAKELADELRSVFHHVEVLRLPDSKDVPRVGIARHDETWQLFRRRHLAKARNRLLSHALGSVGRHVRWILWMDSDVRHVSSNLIQHLLSANRSVVTANCLWKDDRGKVGTFDKNTWQETNESRAEIQKMKPEELMLDGYAETGRRYLSNLVDEGDVVPIDGVGGCTLLVDADLHRSGLVFPPFVFDHHIETEGLAKMAAKLGVRLYGLPSVSVVHW